MTTYCSENMSKIGNHAARLDNLEKSNLEDLKIRDMIFEELKETNNKVNKIDKDISILGSSFEGFKHNMTNNYCEFKEDMKNLFNSIFTKSIAVITIMTIVSKVLDIFWK